MLNITSAKSDISRTNQVRIEDTPQMMADRFFQYLFKNGKSIETFPITPEMRYDGEGTVNYRERDRQIRQEVKKRLSVYKDWQGDEEPQYFVEYVNKQGYVYFLSPNKNHSGWKDMFRNGLVNHRQRVLNLIFKFYILSLGMSSEAITGFEYVILPITKKLSEKSDTLYVWGLEVQLNFNPFQVVTMHLAKSFRAFSPRSKLHTLDGEELGEIQVYNKQPYYYNYQTDARKKNNIYFMDFRKNDVGYAGFKQTQLYYYQMLMNELESFLKECGIKFTALNFQCQGYLENSYIHDEHLAQVKSLGSLVIINNTGFDLDDKDRLFLSSFFNKKGVINVEFYQYGKTISRYSPVLKVDRDDCWNITEVFPWSKIKPENGHNYLVLNRKLDEDSGSMAYQGKDSYWYTSSDLGENSKVDFYSQFKQKNCFLATGDFYSMQGINVDKFSAVGSDKDSAEDIMVLTYAHGKVDEEDLRRDCASISNGQFLSIEDNIVLYTALQADVYSWEKFCEKYKVKVSPEFQRVLIEIGIKSWIRAGLLDHNLGLPINDLTLPECQFYVIFVRSPRYGESKAVAVNFYHKDGFIYINGVIRDMREIGLKFPFLEKRLKGNTERLYNEQLYYVDEDAHTYITNYTKDYYTPTLIGRYGIVEELGEGTLDIGRKTREANSTRLLPIVTYYNGEITPMNSVQNMICLDIEQSEFIQYYIPPKSGLNWNVKHGFRVYHLIGKRDGKSLTTKELIDHPLTAFHFNTLTQNILRISDNSQSSLLQKVVRVLIEN